MAAHLLLQKSAGSVCLCSWLELLTINSYGDLSKQSASITYFSQDGESSIRYISLSIMDSSPGNHLCGTTGSVCSFEAGPDRVSIVEGALAPSLVTHVPAQGANLVAQLLREKLYCCKVKKGHPEVPSNKADSSSSIKVFCRGKGHRARRACPLQRVRSFSVQSGLHSPECSLPSTKPQGPQSSSYISFPGFSLHSLEHP